MIRQTVAQPFVHIPLWSFNQAEWNTLQALKARYLANRDLFDSLELARLEFVRWLYQCGRIEP